MMIGLTMITPCVYGIITNMSLKRYDGLNTALQNIMQRLGYTVASIAIGFISKIWSIELNFALLAVLSVVMCAMLILLRLRWKLKNELYRVNHPKGFHAPYSL
jgi:MFS family permease